MVFFNSFTIIIIAASLTLLAAAQPSSFLGVNLGNVLEAPLEGQWAPAAEEAYFDAYLAAKLTVIRVPVRWDNHTLQSAPYTINATWLARVKEVVTWGTSRGLPVIINSHHDDWIDIPDNFETELPRFKAIWTQVSAYFSDFSDTLLHFEVLNEPVKMNVTQLNEMNAAIIPIMRQLNPTRPIYLGGLQWMSPYWILNNPDTMIFPLLPNGAVDPNLRLETHSYDPYNSCGGKNVPLTPTDFATISALYANISNWGVTRHIAVLMGEAGCEESENRPDRLKWYETIGAGSKLLSGLTFWDDDGNFGILNRQTMVWDQGILDALYAGRG